MNRQQLLDATAAAHRSWVTAHGDQVPAIPADSAPHDGGISDYAEHHADRSAPAAVDDVLSAQLVGLLDQHHTSRATTGTREAGRLVDDAGDVILDAGWIPPVPSVLVDLREAGSDRRLRKYWVSGDGATKIGWGAAGDFGRCVSHLGKYVSDPEGLCAEYHKAATGQWPGKGRDH